MLYKFILFILHFQILLHFNLIFFYTLFPKHFLAGHLKIQIPQGNAHYISTNSITNGRHSNSLQQMSLQTRACFSFFNIYIVVLKTKTAARYFLLAIFFSFFFYIYIFCHGQRNIYLVQKKDQKKEHTPVLSQGTGPLS